MIWRVVGDLRAYAESLARPVGTGWGARMSAILWCFVERHHFHLLFLDKIILTHIKITEGIADDMKWRR